jgi:pimeloyl-ACP methyl ester carboxylesterase
VASFTEERYRVNGVDVAVLAAGEGPPLVYFHGAGTLTGLDALLPLAERFRLIAPYHPGYGPSADDPSVDSIHDYLLHYLDLLDLLEVDELTLVGFSMGGLLASWFAIEQTPRVKRLVLAAPLGLRVREHPTVDIFAIPDEELFSYLTEDMSVLAGNVPLPPTPEFLAERYRESTSTARMFWNRSYDPKLPKWLHRVTMPTLILWGEADRLIPSGQGRTWAELIPHAELRILPGIGHLMLEETRDAVSAALAFCTAAESPAAPVGPVLH